MSERTARRQENSEPELAPEPDELEAKDLAVLSPLAEFLDDVEGVLSELREYARIEESRKRRRGGATS